MDSLDAFPAVLARPSVRRMPSSRTMPRFVCPSCGSVGMAAHHPTGLNQTAKPGDFALCLHCGEPAVFDASLHARKPHAEELAFLAEASPATFDEMLRSSERVRRSRPA